MWIWQVITYMHAQLFWIQLIWQNLGIFPYSILDYLIKFKYMVILIDEIISIMLELIDTLPFLRPSYDKFTRFIIKGIKPSPNESAKM